MKTRNLRTEVALLSIRATLEVEVGDLLKAGVEIWEIEKAIKRKYGEGWRFNRTEHRYETCIMAVFEQ